MADPRDASPEAAAPGTRRSRPPRYRLRLTLLIGTSSLALLLGVAAFLARWGQPRADEGAGWRDVPGGVRAVEVAPGGAAWRAGVQVGDTLVAIGGRPIASSLQAESVFRAAPPGASLPVMVQRDGLVRLVDLRPDAAPDDRHLYAYLCLVGLLSLGLGTVLAGAERVGPVRVPYYLLSLAAFVALVFSHSGRGDALDWMVYWADAAARLLLVPSLLQFARAFARPGGAPRAGTAALYAPAVALLGIEIWLVGGEAIYRFADPVAALERLHRWQAAYLALGLAAAMVLLGAAYLRATHDRIRRPLKWLLWGGTAGFGPFVVLYLFPSALGLPLPSGSDLSALTLLVVPLCFASAVAGYRLTDLEIFLKRGLSTAALAGSAVGVYLAAVVVLRRVLPPDAAGAPEVLAVALAAALLPRLRTLVHGAVDRIFYRDRYDPRRTLQEFGRDLSREREIGPLVDKLARRIGRTLGFGRVVVLVGDPDAGECREHPEGSLAIPLDAPLALALGRGGGLLDLEDIRDPRAEAAPAQRFEEAGLRYLVPLTVQGGLVGLLALGERRDGLPLHSEDRDLLEAVARQASVALEGARLFEQMGRRAREIERLKDFNERILENSQVGVLVVDEAGRIAGWNRALSELTGHPRDRAIGRALGEVFDREFTGVLQGGLAESADHGARRYREYLRGAGGAPARLVNLGFSPLRLPGGTSWVVTFDDITEGVRREQILIQQERLASIGLLASGIAHEVNTPLTGISSYAQMLLEETPPDDARRPLLEKIEKQTFRAADIARRLLNFSRPDRQGLVDVGCNELVEETLSLFGPQIRGRKVFVRRELAPALPLVRGHRGKLQQVLLNLLLNAHDAITDGGEIVIRTAAEGEGVLLEVSDTGEGIRPELLGRIFDPYFTTKAPGHGTGLGLSIAYGIVQEHAGTIGVDSTPGEGTRFQVRLPARARARAVAN
jgi:PAS domain S-box-containing protein